MLILVSCSNEVPVDILVERQGVSYEVNSTTPFTGGFVGYHENGQLLSKGNYKDGKEEGFQEKFFDNGQLQEKKKHRERRTGSPSNL